MTTEHNLPPYALVLAKVKDRQRGDVLVQLTGPSGEPMDIWIDDSSVAPLSKDDATTLACSWNVALPD